MASVFSSTPAQWRPLLCYVRRAKLPTPAATFGAIQLVARPTGSTLTLVVLHGLLGTPSLNGRHGHIERREVDTARLAFRRDIGGVLNLVKPINLRLNIEAAETDYPARNPCGRHTSGGLDCPSGAADNNTDTVSSLSAFM